MKFQYAIRMVRFMVRLLVCLKSYANNKSQQSIEQVAKNTIMSLYTIDSCPILHQFSCEAAIFRRLATPKAIGKRLDNKGCWCLVTG